MAQEVDVARLLDERKPNRFTVGLVALAFLVVLSDGFDINNIGYAAPHIMRDWAINDQSSFALVFSASLVGIFFGSPIFGYVGDRAGRRVAIITSCFVYGISTLATIWVQSLPELIALRIVCGMGIGAMFPNIIALVAEFAPNRLRATMIIVMFTGVGIGSALPGPVAAFFVPTYGWQILFSSGGLFAILVGFLCLAWLPESIKFLIVRQERKGATLRLLRKLLPDRVFDAASTYVIGGEVRYAGFSPKILFAGGLAIVTPILWLLFACSLLGYFFLISWTPTLLASLHMSASEAAIATAGFQFGGVVGGWAICRPMDRYGLLPVLVLFGCAIPLVAAIGYAGSWSHPVLSAVLFLAGFCVLGCQYAINAFAGIVYPTAYRANGTGWAFAMGRFGSILGPVLGGILIARHLPTETLYLWSAVPFVLCTVLCFILMRLQTGDRMPAPRAGAAVMADETGEALQ